MSRAYTGAPTSNFLVRGPQAASLQPVALRLPGADRPWRQALALWRAAMCSPMREHRLQPDRKQPYSADVALTEDLFVRWQQALDIPAACAAAVPLAYHPHQRALLASRILSDLGVHQRHARHVQHRFDQVACPALASARGAQQLQCSLRKAMRLGEDLALVVLETRLTAPGAGLLSVARDSFLVPHLPVADLAGLPADRQVMREFVGLRHRRAEIEPAAPGSCVRWLRVDRHRASEFAGVSGLCGPLHGLAWPAWARRDTAPGLQGLGVRNRIVRHLADMGARLDRMSLTLVRHAPAHGALCLVVAGQDFEVCDDAGRLLAFGQSAG
jgi:hypothetical protein